MPILVFTVLLSSCGKSQSFQKLDASNIDNEKLKLAKELTTRILNTQKAGSYYQLTTEEAETRMISAFTETVQRSAYDQVSGAYGDYEKLEFKHVVVPTDGTLYEIYRFKGIFQSEDASIEIRTVLNAKGKLAGFFLKPWKDEM